MATKKTLAGKTRAPKARAEKPVSEGIRRAAERSLLQVAVDAGVPIVCMPEPEFRSVTAQLKELTHTIVESWACRDGFHDGLEDVLVALYAARRNLETACDTRGGAS